MPLTARVQFEGFYHPLSDRLTCAPPSWPVLDMPFGASKSIRLALLAPAAGRSCTQSEEHVN